METKESDKWKTPSWLMATFKDFWDATPPDYTEDCLTIDWKPKTFINPPYSKPLPFVEKAIEQNKKNDVYVVLLLKCDPSTKVYRILNEAGAHFAYFNERLHYSDSKQSPNFPSMLAFLPSINAGVSSEVN